MRTMSASTRHSSLVLAAALALAGCGGAAATPETIYVHLPTAAETPTPELTPTPEPTPGLTPTPEPTPSGSPSDSPSPTSPAGACTGTAAHQAYFVKAASALHFDVYCAVLPKGWWLEASEYTEPDGGRMFVLYKNNAGDVIYLSEGRLCADLTNCTDIYPGLGAASFGGMAGTLKDMGGGGRLVVVNPHSIPGYAMYGFGVTQAQLLQYAAAVVKVSKPAP